MQSQPIYTLSIIPDGPEGVRVTLREMSKITQVYKKAPAIREMALSLVRDLPSKAWSMEVKRLHAFVRDNIRYTRDILGCETLQTPVQTLRVGQGDCDDKSMLLGSLLNAIFHPVRYVAIGFQPNSYVHVFPETKIAGKWVALETTENWPVGRRPAGVKAVMIENVPAKTR